MDTLPVEIFLTIVEQLELQTKLKLAETHSVYRNIIINEIIREDGASDEIVKLSATLGLVDVFRYLHENEISFNKNADICTAAATNGHLTFLVYAHENGYRWDLSTSAKAALNGHLDCLTYAREHGCPWNADTCANAALNGHLECLKYARENGCPWDLSTPANAALNGHLDCLMYAQAIWNWSTCANAALNGHLVCLRFARENGCPWNEETCANAALNGHLECLKYAHENMDWFTCANAAKNGHMDCLKYAHENGCSLDSEFLILAITQKRGECVQYLLENYCPVTNGAFLAAINNDDSDLAMTLADVIVRPPSLDVCHAAAQRGFLELLKNFQTPMDLFTLCGAAEGGHLDCLQYLHNYGAYDDVEGDACAAAAVGGHLHCLQWLHLNQYPITSWTFSEAIRIGNVPCINYLRENDCPN
jgi:hypothetical protein